MVSKDPTDRPVVRKRSATKAPHPRPTGVTVKTIWSEDHEAYVVALEAADDVVVTLTPVMAFDHARGVLAAAHRAAYDAAVVNQLTTKLNLPLNTVATVANLIRDERSRLDPADTDPLRFEPGVDGKTLRPYITVSVGIEPVGQWSVAEADGHARTVLSAVEKANLDTVYHQVLTATMGMDEWRAKNMVADVGTFRRYN